MEPLLNGARGGRVEEFHYLLWQGFHLDKPNTAGETAIQMAATYGHHKLVEIMLDLGAVVYNAIPPLGSSTRATESRAVHPLVAATRNSDVRVMETLLGRGPPHSHVEVILFFYILSFVTFLFKYNQGHRSGSTCPS